MKIKFPFVCFDVVRTRGRTTAAAFFFGSALADVRGWLFSRQAVKKSRDTIMNIMCLGDAKIIWVRGRGGWGCAWGLKFWQYDANPSPCSRIVRYKQVIHQFDRFVP